MTRLDNKWMKKSHFFVLLCNEEISFKLGRRLFQFSLYIQTRKMKQQVLNFKAEGEENESNMWMSAKLLHLSFSSSNLLPLSPRLVEATIPFLRRNKEIKEKENKKYVKSVPSPSVEQKGHMLIPLLIPPCTSNKVFCKLWTLSSSMHIFFTRSSQNFSCSTPNPFVESNMFPGLLCKHL